MFDKLEELVQRYQEVLNELAEPTIAKFAYFEIHFFFEHP